MDVPESSTNDAAVTTPIWVYVLLLVLLLLVLLVLGAWKRSARKLANTRRILADLKRHGGSSSIRQSVRVALGGASDAARGPIDQDANLGYLAIEGAEPGCRDADDIESPNHAYADLHEHAAVSDGRVSPVQPSTAQTARATAGSGFTHGGVTITNPAFTNPAYQGEQSSVRSYLPPDLRHSQASARASKVPSNMGDVAVGVQCDDELGSNTADYAVVDNVVAMVLAHSLASTEPADAAAVDSTTDYAIIHTGEDDESNIPAHAMGTAATMLLSDPAQQDSRTNSVSITATGLHATNHAASEGNEYAVIRDLTAHEDAGLDSTGDPVYAQLSDGCVYAVNAGTTAGMGPEGNGELSAAALSSMPYDTVEVQSVPITPLPTSTAAAVDTNYEVLDNGRSPAVAGGHHRNVMYAEAPRSSLNLEDLL